MARVRSLTSARRARRVLLVAALVAVGLLATADPPPASASPTSTACPRQLVPSTSFTDTLRSSHRVAIDCADWWGIVQGRSTTSFAPELAVTRGQTSAMIARMQRGTVGVPATPELPETAPQVTFVDLDGHRFAQDIEALAAQGVVRGVDAERFVPDLPINRAQMASIIDRFFERGVGIALPDGSVPFDDVSPGSVHAGAIGRLVAAGITTGTTPRTYDPGAPVTRAQMASFLTRAASLLVDAELTGLPEQRPGLNDPYTSSIRAAWVHLFDGRLKSAASIASTLDELAAADVSHVIAQVARRHDAYYDSDVLPRTSDPTLAADLDVLQTLIDGAQARGMQLHAWISVAPSWHDVYRDLPAPAGWIATEHGRTAPESQRWVTRNATGTWSTYLDMGVPAVQDHVAAVVAEIVERYDVDGIHLDYVRYEGADRGYNPAALAAYRRDTGATGTPAPTDPTFTRWRRDQATQVIRRARDEIDASGRDVTLSAAVISWGPGPSTPDLSGFRTSSPYTRTLQDWDRWARSGLVDLLLPMNYFRAHVPTEARWFSQWLAYERALSQGVDVAIVPGIGGYLNRPVNVLDQIELAMQRTDGAAVYSAQQPTVDGTRRVLDQLGRTRWMSAPLR